MLALCFSTAVQAEKLSLEIRGLDGILLSNATATVENLVVSQDDSISQRRLTSLLEEVESRVDSSLRPLGYYHARTTSSVLRNNDLPQTIVLDVNRGSPVRVAEASVQLDGPGASLGELQAWRANWPLPVGAVLDHSLWEGAKQEALSALEYRGYIEAAFTDHRIEIDLDGNEARLFLALATGPRAVMGEVRFEQEIIQSDLLTKLPRFNPGQPYDGFLLEKLRQDLWRTGFFTTVEVVEEVQLGDCALAPRGLTLQENLPDQRCDGLDGVRHREEADQRQVRVGQVRMNSFSDSPDLGAAGQCAECLDRIVGHHVVELAHQSLV